jgi:ribosomal protein S27AE
MATRCANCGGYFSAGELARSKPPAHPWQLTRPGEKALYENQQRGGQHPQCPNCGQQTLVA